MIKTGKTQDNIFFNSEICSLNPYIFKSLTKKKKNPVESEFV